MLVLVEAKHELATLRFRAQSRSGHGTESINSVVDDDVSYIHLPSTELLFGRNPESGGIVCIWWD